ncbi:serine hydrolase domain-containing protein [Streptomyces hainanensis]|uniref:Class A beta-lactamase-related serine hydrolase n=1 Tax=Streptomyces hainanensis TaxID=402648 RepID=A0A4R4SJR0_9ACTN|nr:serine hydrolase domain-containing protein [Streptomyces hainanensis]TDC63860.1 class A beta-lactamase-related serine hydrolase [Streptomyces hainanensis]
MFGSLSRRGLLGLFGAASLTAGAAGDAGAAPTRPGGGAASGVTEEFARFVAAEAAADRFSGTVLLAHRGRPVLVRSHGMADRASSRPNTEDTVFCLASITKTFTALAVAQLAERGALSFTDTLGHHLEGFPAEVADTVTIHQLLTHTSGVGRPAIGNGELPTWSSHEEVIEGTVDIARRTPLQFTPGTRFGYSNDGYVVLGAIVARASGVPFVDHVRQQVFEPARMGRTGFPGRPEARADAAVARPYWTQPSGERVDLFSTDFAPYSYGPAGGAYTTAADLLAFVRALTAGRLLGPALTALVTAGKTPVPPADGSQVEFYGYGYRDAVVNGQRVWGHSGGAPGTATRLDVFPDREWVAIVLSNYDTSVGPIVSRARELVTAR